MSLFKMCCKLYAVLFCLMQTYLLLFPMFMLAYSSGTYKCMMDINSMGEASIEIVFWIVSFPFIIYGTCLVLQDIIRRE